ncbi:MULTISPECIES: NUDIX domain-containing protein [unclassified Lysinibacillus]|uniref:NUDIX hydrolase n=1 Tax=unclassified Lysinibacillus TaxID=2636778 RepID=UPI002553CC38|nr:MULTISPECIES: NUDIX domain-containing protein [unclassified Lysinibacillus]MDM5250639.1 NUDIX domain-containing protein [Lysinibacillus sp. G4S2]
MEQEIVKVFNEQHEQIGTATRAEVHEKGLWHETFHCWLVNEDYIYFQIRSAQKKDYPGLLDITAAGHLLATETVESGIREVKEELGLDIHVHEIVKMGMTSCSIVSKNMIDNEFCHVFTYPFKHDWDSFELQYEEVSGVVRAKLDEAEAFFLGETATLNIEGYEYFPDGIRAKIVRPVSAAQFVPYRELYVAHVIQFVKDKMFNKTS